MSFGARCTSELEKRGVRAYRPPEIQSAQGLVAHFVAQIAPSLKALVNVLAIGPARPAYDASAAILSLGFGFTYLSVYETLPLLALSEDECRHYRDELDGVVCFASPSAVQGFVETLMSGGHKELGAKLVAVAIGETTALKCRDHFCKVHGAATQELTALVEKAGALLGQL
jgi:uroporphyrinogen-III synthase